MTGASVLTDIRSMIDFAIGTPESGVVDFCMLHTVLHCLAQQINALDKPVELLGGAPSVTVASPARDVQTVAITEYIVETSTADTPMKPKSIKPPRAAESTLLVVERVKKDSSQSQSSASPVRPGTGVRPSSAKVVASVMEPHEDSRREEVGSRREEVMSRTEEGGSRPEEGGSRREEAGNRREEVWSRREEVRTVIEEGGTRQVGPEERGPGEEGQFGGKFESKGREAGPPRQITSTEKLSLVTLSKFNLLEGAVKDLKDRVYGIIPKNEQILGEVRSQTNLKAITDMWTNLNVSSRLEAAETGLTKLSSLVEDLIRGMSAPGSAGVAATPSKTPASSVTPAAQTNFDQAPPAKTPASSVTPAAQTNFDQSQTNLKAITDMWTSLNVSSRLEAAETGLAKLSSLMEDLIRGMSAPGSAGAAATPPAKTPASSVTPAAQTNFDHAPGSAGAAATPPAKTPASPVTPAAQTNFDQAPGSAGAAASWPAKTPASPDTPAAQTYFDQTQTGLAQCGPPYPWETMAAQQSYERDVMLQQLQRLRDDLDLLNKTFYDAMDTIQNNIEIKGDVQLAPPPPPPPPPPVIQQLPPMHPIAPPAADGHVPMTPVSTERKGTDMTGVGRHVPVTPGSTERSGTDMIGVGRHVPVTPVSRRSSGVTAALADRLAQLERRVKECCDGMGKDKGVVGDQMGNFQDQLDHLRQQVAVLHEDFAALKLSPNLARDLEGLMQLYQTVQEMQEQLRQVNEVARQLAGEKEDRQNHIKALLEQIEILKTIKMDREDMAEAMAEKADLRLLARKVSHDQFEMACDDLSRGLDHALGKLNTQEALWQQVLDDVQREIETKLDKMELSPLKEFFENKLRLLQENLKQMASLRKNVEAAGTTRRLLRDVNCISCDADAVMPMENAAVMPSKPLPAHLSMKPYLSYELDTIRKTQASSLPQRNLHDWETIEKQKAPKAPVKVRSDTDKHICNRYCGGAHTTTTPAQRVARTGHFIKQWGPDVVPLSSGMAAGDDGRLYKVSTAENANVGPGASVEPCTKKPKPPAEPAKPPPKPVIITNKECRCLD